MIQIKKFSDLIAHAQESGPIIVAAASADDVTVLGALAQAQELSICQSILVGNRDKIINICNTDNIDWRSFEIIDQANRFECACIASKIVSAGEANCLMKGSVSTAEFMKAVLSKEYDLLTDRLLSHIALLESPLLGRIILSTDGAINISPSLEDKVQLILNILNVTRILGIEHPHIAVLAAVEYVYEKMVSTMDAAKLVEMSKEGIFNEAILDGPLGFDNAISKRAAEHKNINSEVAGRADGLVCPDLESGIMVVKAAVYLGGVKNAGVVVGARVPIILTSRSDLLETKLVSIATASLLFQNHNNQRFS